MKIKQFIFKEMENKGYVLDQEVFNFLGKEPNYYTIELYKKEWLGFKRAKEYFIDFENNKNTIIRKSGRRYLIIIKMSESLGWYLIPKSYFNYLKEKGVEIV